MSDDLTHIVFSGGGMCGLAYIGAIRFLQVEGLDKHIRYVSGSSIGAVFATILALRIPLHDIEQRLMQMMCTDALTFHYPDMLSMLHSFGIDDGHKFLAFLKTELDKLTFIDLTKRTGVHLTICATHLQTMTPTYFSVDNTPHVLVYDALRASIAVPWIMKPVVIGEDMYVDGGITDNIPLAPFEHTNTPVSSILILYINQFAPVQQAPLSSPWVYTYTILQRFISPSNYCNLLRKIYPHIVFMENMPVAFIPTVFEEDRVIVRCSQKEMEDTIVKGYTDMYNHFYGKK
jgi:NTE family protein